MIIEEYFFLFLTETNVVTPHLNCLSKTVQMMGHNICFYAELTKLSLIIIKYYLLPTALRAPYKVGFFRIIHR